MKSKIFFSCVLFCFFLVGCASLQETGKKIWGSSISHLEAARSSGKSFVVVLTPDATFAKILELFKDTKVQVYLKDPAKRYLAAMNFPGHVDTTEVGIFLTPQENNATKVEIASMSPGLVDQVTRFLDEGFKKKTEGKE